MVKAVLSNTTKLYGLSSSQAAEVKEALTLPNPAYIAAVRHSRINRRYIKIPPNLLLYNSQREYLEVPSGYTPAFDASVTKDLRRIVNTKYPSFLLTLRDTQEEAAEAYLNSSDGNGIISLPTGKGKSILGVYLAARLQQKTLVVVHKDDLFVSWQKDILACLGIEAGVLKAQKRKIADTITIASVQTLNSIRKRDEQLYSSITSQFGMLVVDEAHHCPASTYDIINDFSARFKLGLSATPERNDGLTKIMEYYLGEIIFSYKADRDDEDILPVDVYVHEDRTEVMPYVRAIPRPTRSNPANVIYELLPFGEEGRYRDAVPLVEVPRDKAPRIPFSEIENTLFYQTDFLKTVRTLAIKEARKHYVVVFFNQRHHCETFLHMVQKKAPELSVQLYYGDMELSDAEVLERIERGDVHLTIATYKKATEGTNVKRWEVGILAGSIVNGLSVEQVSGRLRRRMEGKLSPAKLHDFRLPLVFSFAHHGISRQRRYRKLSFRTIQCTNQSTRKFSRGYR